MIKVLFQKEKRTTHIILIIIMIIAALLRYKGLKGQSLWLDELHTMNEADPLLPWSSLFHTLKTSDQHPPLFFVLERFCFSIFGYTERGARILPVLAGILSVWGAYLLGKTILNERLGLIAAAITCVNYYSIFYSQEARDYSFLWLFTTLSYAYFLRLYQSLKRSDAIWYIVTTVLLLYSHYFSLMVLGCQFILFLAFWALEKENRKQFFLTFFISAVIIVVAYLPWLPFLKEMGKIKSFWIQLVWEDFYFNYFNEYFGNAPLLYIFLYIFLISYIVNVILTYSEVHYIKKNPIVLSFVFIFISILFSYMIPYLRSFFVVPMLIERYTIIVIPSLITCIAYGVYLIKTPVVRYSLLATFILLSLFDIIFVKEFYIKPHKEQFREVTQLLTERPAHPVINELTGWHQSYYIKTMNYKGDMLEGNKNDIVDSILAKSSPRYATDSFWLVSFHGDSDFNPQTQANLDTAFVLAAKYDYIGGWAKLYGRKK